MLSADQKRLYAAGLLLHNMHRHEQTYDVLLLGADEKLQPTLEWLLMKELVELNKTHHYALTDKGILAAKTLTERYQEILTYFDVFAHVDLEEGEFALASYGNFSHSADWQAFLNQDRWHDLRLAVLAHLGGDPAEFVFLQFVQEERFDISSAGWQLSFSDGALWQEITTICEGAITAEDLGYEEGDVQVSATDILNDITQQGFSLLKHLYPEDKEIHANLQSWYPEHGVVNTALLIARTTSPLWKRAWHIS